MNLRKKNNFYRKLKSIIQNETISFHTFFITGMPLDKLFFLVSKTLSPG